jgi:hypothetical protein
MSRDEIRMSDELWELSIEQAQEVLDAFLRVEREAFQSLTIGSIDLDYSPESVRKAVHHIASEIAAGHLDEEERNSWYARLGYYFGESLCRAKPGLTWGLGDPEYAFANHPVVTGFARDEEAPVITICRNLINSVVKGRSPSARIDTAVKSWFSKSAEGR